MATRCALGAVFVLAGMSGAACGGQVGASSGGDVGASDRESPAVEDATPQGPDSADAPFGRDASVADAIAEQDSQDADIAEACVLLPPQDAASQCVDTQAPDGMALAGTCCAASFQAPQQFCVTDGCGFWVHVETTPPECVCGDTYDCQCIAAAFGVQCPGGAQYGPWCAGGGSEGVIFACGDPAC